MGKITIVLTYPDAKQNELIAALRWHYGLKTQDAQGDPIEPPVEYTAAELLQLIREGHARGLRDIYKRHRKFLRDQGALDDLEVTGDTT